MGPFLEPPSDLGPDGLRAFDLGVEQISGFDNPEKFYDAVLAFARATEMVEVARREWVSLGRPWRTINPNGAEGIHPIVKVIRDLESDAYRARRALKLSPDTIKRAGPGRPPGTGSASDRKAPPVVKLSTKNLKS